MSSFVRDALEEIRRKVQPTPNDLRQARDRRDDVLAAATDFDGVLRTFSSGSIAHGTALVPANDADCGLVLDRRVYPKLGPDGDGVGSSEVVEQIRTHLRDELRESHPEATYRVTKRAIFIGFGDDGPTVDLVVALNRKDAPGLWIPHTHDDDWDASHPEKHTELIATANKATSASVFARAVRICKAWNNQFGVKLCSFNVEALALDGIVGETNIEDATLAWFKHAETDLKKRLTPDPAGVSDAIKMPTGLTRDQASDRIGLARRRLELAQKASDDEKAAEEMKKAFPDYEQEIDKVRLDRKLNGTAKSSATVASVAPFVQAKQPRAWGDETPWTLD